MKKVKVENSNRNEVVKILPCIAWCWGNINSLGASVDVNSCLRRSSQKKKLWKIGRK